MSKKTRKTRNRNVHSTAKEDVPAGKPKTVNYRLIGGLALVVLLFYVGLNSGSILNPPKADAPTAPLAGAGKVEESGQPAVISQPSDVSVVRIPLSELSGSIRKYTYDSGGVSVRYIVVLGSDGQVRTAFDACDVCGGKKGYRQQGSDVVCNNCGRSFRIDELGTKNRAGGGCWPSYLPHSLEGQYIILKKSDLDSGKRFF